tara:strand:+ start:90 stop:947 length:858 start_codon:yes stop_codon:yes gene_type:complete
MNSYSQHQEDKFLLNIFIKKKEKNCFFFEFGAWDGIHLSNCRLLYENNWSGCFVELDQKKYKELENNYKKDQNIITLNEKIDYKLNNINKLILENNIKKIDVMSIDVDGADLLIWKSLNVLEPKVIIIEYNGTIPFDTNFEDNTDRNIGSSYLAIDNYAKSKNYELIKATIGNLIFIKKDFNNNLYKPLDMHNVYSICKPFRVGFNNYGEYLFFKNNELNYQEFFRSPQQKNFITFQPIPKFLRNLTDENGYGAAFLKRFYSLLIFLLLRPILFLKYIFIKIVKK